MGHNHSTTAVCRVWPMMLMCLGTLCLVVGMVSITRPASTSPVVSSDEPAGTRSTGLQVSADQPAPPSRDAVVETLLPFDIHPYQAVVPGRMDERHEQDGFVGDDPVQDQALGRSDASLRTEIALLEELSILAAAVAWDEAGSAAEQGGVGTVLFMTSADYAMSDGEPTVQELDIRAAQVAYEADRRLDYLTDTYDLSDEQQRLAYPILARASQAYDPALAIENEEWTDAILAVSARGPGPAVYSDNPIKQAAIDSALNTVEDQLSEILDEDQVIAIKVEQADRNEWWNEILSQVSSDLEVEEAAAQALEELLAAEAAEAADASEHSQSGSAPAAHQGGNLLNLLGAGP